MIIVIIAGGSGTRLWPLSTPDYPKHLLCIGDDGISLLLQTYERVKKLSEKIYIVSEVSHITHVKEQLRDLPNEAFIVEPARRGTANCIALALAKITKLHDSSEAIAFMPADHYIRNIAGFIHSFKIADATSRAEKRLVLVGIEPDYPATGFGYIEKGSVFNEQALVYEVRSFKEKPDYDTARKYLRSGRYLWNSGYFVATLATFEVTMSAHAPELNASYQMLALAKEEDVDDVYRGLESAAIDYVLIENVINLLVVPASFDWLDIGSYADLAKVTGGDSSGNYLQGKNIEIENVNNTYVYTEGDKPVAVIGLDNVVVVNTPHGILVTRKDTSQSVGEVSKRFKQ